MRQMHQMSVLITETKQATDKKIEELIQIIEDLQKTNEEAKKTLAKQQNHDPKILNNKRRL